MDPLALKKYIYHLGASQVGFASLKALEAPAGPVHLRQLDLPYAISIASRMSDEVVSSLSHGPTMAYYEEYVKKNALLNYIATKTVEQIKGAGYRASIVKATVVDDGADGYIESFNNSLPHKTVATLSGLGWVGKSLLLISFEHGPRVRLGTVLTDMPLDAPGGSGESIGRPITRGMCGDCRACVEACPVRAIKGREWEVGVSREGLYDPYLCRRKALELSGRLGIRDSLCGICIWACPVGAQPVAD